MSFSPNGNDPSNHPYSDEPNAPPPNSTRRWRIVGWALGCLGLGFAAWWEVQFAFIGASAFGNCSSEAQPVACSSGMQWAASNIPMLGACLGFLVALVVPWIRKPSPRLVWLLVGVGIQLAALVVMCAIAGAAVDVRN